MSKLDLKYIDFKLEEFTIERKITALKTIFEYRELKIKNREKEALIKNCYINQINFIEEYTQSIKKFVKDNE